MSIKVSVIIYLTTILTSVFAFHIAGISHQKVKRRIAVSFAIAIPVLVAGVRYSIGTDYFAYIEGFELIRYGLDVRWNMEYGYKWLNILLAYSGLCAQSIMFAASLIMMSFISKALLKKREVISVGMGALTFMLLFYQSSFNIVRMMIAVSIFLYNIINIENRKLLKYLFFTVLAASFHISALVTAPVYWIFWSFRVERNLFRRILLYGGAGLFIIFFNPILEWLLSVTNIQSMSYYSQYIGASNKSVGEVIKQVILYLPLVIPGALMYKKCMKQDKNFYIYYSLVVIGVIMVGLSIFTSTYVDRLAEYFTVAAVMVVPVYMDIFIKENKLFFYVGMIYYLFLFWIYIYFICNNHGTVPFQWIL